MRALAVVILLIPSLASLTACDRLRGGNKAGADGGSTASTAAGNDKVGSGAPLTGEPVKSTCDLRAEELASAHKAIDGKPMLVACPANCAEGAVWGVDLYTDDSVVCRAAIHAGATTTAGGHVAVTFAKGQRAYLGSSRNGVASASFGKFARSFYVQALDAQNRPVGAVPAIYDDNTALVDCGAPNPFDGTSGSYTIVCVADCMNGAVWGSNPYTGDSSACAAAHHAGVIDATKRKFKITLGPAKSSFKGSTAHGITSSDFEHYPSTFTVSKLD
jgi:hypothetical protein